MIFNQKSVKVDKLGRWIEGTYTKTFDSKSIMTSREYNIWIINAILVVLVVILDVFVLIILVSCVAMTSASIWLK